MTIIIQLLGIFSALAVLIYVFILVRKKKLTDEYATLWLVTAFLFFFSSIFSKQIFFAYRYLKGSTGSGIGILLFISVIAIIFLLIILTSKVSIHQEHIKNLTQNLGMLDQRLRQKEKEQGKTDEIKEPEVLKEKGH